MSQKRLFLLGSLAFLTVFFVGAAAYTFFDNPLPPDSFSQSLLPVGEVPQALRLTVHRTGIAAVSSEQLRNLRFPVETLDANSLILTREGKPVPFYIEGQEEDATLYFFAEAITRSVEAPAVYWLAPGRGKTMAQRDGSPHEGGATSGWQQQHWEENSAFQPEATGSDNWLGQRLFAPGTLEIPLNDIQPAGGPGRLSIRVWSSNQAPADPDHHLELWLDDKQLADYYWDGVKEETLELALAPGDLSPDSRLVLNVPGDTGAAGESIYLDWIKLEYDGELTLDDGQLLFKSNAGTMRVEGAGAETLVFEVNDPDAPVLLINTEVNGTRIRFAGSRQSSTYVVLNPTQAIQPHISAVPQRETPLRNAERGADYIVIVPDGQEFTEALQPLLAHREAGGLRVTTVSLQQIYDEFAYGQRRPEAIRDFLAHAWRTWHPPAPHFVLLVGDATYDVHGYTDGSNANILPTYLVHTEYAGYVASDGWFTMFEEGRRLPRMAIGRLPAQSVAQLKIMIDKTIAYETEQPRDWLTRALLVADDDRQFNAASDWVAEQLSQGGYRPQKLHMSENEDTRDAIISALNHGVGIVNYAGHGSIEAWGNETVLRTEDASTLMNGNRLPVFTTFTCLNGYFNHPTIDALAETLLWTEDGGVVAAVAPSGRTSSRQQMPMSAAFFNAWLSGEVTTLGDALLQAKIAAADSPDLGKAIHAFNLLGDPALQIRKPEPAPAQE